MAAGECVSGNGQLGFVQMMPLKKTSTTQQFCAGFFKVWPCWPPRRFERPQLFHLNADVVVKQCFSAVVPELGVNYPPGVICFFGG